MSALSSTAEHWCSLLDWRSHRSKRVTRSTLSAETVAAEAGADHTQFLAAHFGMILNNSGLREKQKYLPWAAATDCRSLYDCLNFDNPAASEKRLLIDLAALKESLKEAHLHCSSVPDKIMWVPTAWQLADPMTKLDKHLRAKCTTWLARPMLRLRGHAHDQDQDQMGPYSLRR
eukprot:4044520-Amphidinium_carterae.1